MDILLMCAHTHTHLKHTIAHPRMRRHAHASTHTLTHTYTRTHTARALSYNCTQRLDGCTGLLMLHGLPKHFEEIDLWIEKLDLGIVY